MAGPLIGVTGRAVLAAQAFPEDAAALGRTRIDVHVRDFATALAAAGGVPVQLPLATDPDGLLDHLDGLLLSGGEDIDPLRYGGRPSDRPVDAARDGYELALLAAAERRGTPVLGVCRGLQLINVARGGTLVGDLDAAGYPGHHDPGRPFDTPVHPIGCAPGSATAALREEGTAVNSVHRQAIDALGEGLEATAWAADGVIEAVEAPGAPLLAVQWHPEWHRAELDPVFGWLVQAAGRRHAGAAGGSYRR